MVLYTSEYTLHYLNLIARNNGSTFKKKNKKYANTLVEVLNDGTTVISGKIAHEREPVQSRIIFKLD